eukprot:gene18642-28758_t
MGKTARLIEEEVKIGGNVDGTPADEQSDMTHIHCRNRAGRKAFGEEPNSGMPDNTIKTARYEWWSFLPLNLYLQFTKIANLYFLVNMCFALVPGVSPVFPVTTILPLITVVGVASLRDAFEDTKRHKDDKKANSKAVQVLGSDGFETKPSSVLRAGDVVQLADNTEVPADILLLSSSNDNSTCFVETANLDGETNLKKKVGVPATRGLDQEGASALQTYAFEVLCDKPSPKLSHWNGILMWTDNPVYVGHNRSQKHAASLDNLVLKGCVVRQTKRTYGIVVYPGVLTKMFLNLTPPPYKTSRIDRKLSRLIWFILALQQIVIIALCFANLWFMYGSSQAGAFYLHYLHNEYGGLVQFLLNYLTYFVLLSLLMPISLFVSIEFCKFLQAKFMEWDLNMFDEERGIGMKAKTASLNEELSQIQVVCSDKTGTLTENKMTFASAIIAGERDVFDELAHPGSMVAALQQKESNVKYNHTSSKVGSPEPDAAPSSNLRTMLEIFTLCNTVIASKPEDGDAVKGEGSGYAGDSTDEIALVRAAKQNGFVLLDRFSKQAYCAQCCGVLDYLENYCCGLPAIED